jgi:hypothetical protein
VIVDLLLGALVAMMRGILDLVPVWELDAAALATSGQTVGSFAGMLSGYFPVATLAFSLLTILGFKVFMSGWRLIVFVYDKLPFKMT